MVARIHTLKMDTPSPSNPTAISVRFLFFVPLMLHTLAACVRPLVEPAGFDSVARVKGAPVLSLKDMSFARLAQRGGMGSAWVVARYARARSKLPATGKKVGALWQKMVAGGRWTEAVAS